MKRWLICGGPTPWAEAESAPARNSANPPPNSDQRRSRALATEVDMSETRTTTTIPPLPGVVTNALICL